MEPGTPFFGPDTPTGLPGNRKLARRRKKQGVYKDWSTPFARTAPNKPITESVVSAQSPLSGSQMRQYAPVRPTYLGYGQGSGDKSRQAFAYASALQQRNAQQTGMEDFVRGYRQQQEQLRAGDIEGQRTDQVRRYAMDEDYLAKRRGQEIRRFQRIKDLRTQVNEAEKNARANLLENLFGVALGGLMPALGAAYLARGRGGQSGGTDSYQPMTFQQAPLRSFLNRSLFSN